MKILIGMTRSDTTMSGSFKHIVQIGDSFRAKGIDVVYVLGGDNGPATKKLEDSGFKVIKLKSLRREISFFRDFISCFQLLAVLIAEKPDVCSWHTAKMGAIGRVCSFLMNAKAFYVPHGVPFINTPENKGFKKYEIIEKLLSFLPTTIIGVCKFDREEYLRIGVNPDRVISISNGMNGVSDLAFNTSSNGHIKFITAARFEAQKDYYTLQRACEILLEQKLHFTLDIYGDGEHEEEIRKLFSSLPDGVIKFKGVVDNFAVVLAKADVFLLSTFWEGLPRSIIEAMACKKPIIATDVGGCSELISNDENGFLVKAKCPDEFADAMSYFIRNRDLAMIQGQKSYDKYVKNFTLNAMLDKYCATYGVTNNKD